MPKIARKLPTIVMTHSAYSATRSAEVLAPLPLGKMPTPGYLRAMMEKGAKDAGRDFYDPIVELTKLGLTSDDERIRFACHAHLSDKLYPKAKDWSEGDAADDAERVSKRNALLDQLVDAFSRRALASASK